MKQLVAKAHHPHLKKRAYLEFFGLLALVLISIQQRELLWTAINAIRTSDVLFLFFACATYWLMLPLTTYSYRLLAHRRIPLTTTMLAQLAAAGPGRVIPGGLGHISVGAVHLRKVGFSMQRALVITVSNNLIALLTNVIIVVAAFVIHPNILDTLLENISVSMIGLGLLVILVSVSLFLWLSHAHSTRHLIRKLNTQWGLIIAQLSKRPERLIGLVGIATIIVVGHAFILLLAGEALDVHITLTDAVIALSAGVFIGGAIPTPGGLGAVEAGTISSLLLLGYEPASAASVALLFRVATYWQPLVPGVVAYVYLRERKLL